LSGFSQAIQTSVSEKMLAVMAGLDVAFFWCGGLMC
jgi:hypothetical protein